MSGPLKEPFEIKVYEIDDVERLQRRRLEETTEVSRRSLLTHHVDMVEPLVELYQIIFWFMFCLSRSP